EQSGDQRQRGGDGERGGGLVDSREGGLRWRAEQHPPGVGGDGRERGHDEGERGGGQPGQPGDGTGAGDAEFAGGQGGGGGTEQGEDRQAEQAGQQWRTGGQGPYVGDLAAAVAVQDVPAGQEGDGLGQAVSGHVQQQRGDGQVAADGGGQGEQAHVFHR